MSSVFGAFFEKYNLLVRKLFFHLNGFSFYSRCIFSLNMFLGLKSVAKDLKMDLGRVVVITAKSKSENSLSFRAPIVLF